MEFMGAMGTGSTKRFEEGKALEAGMLAEGRLRADP